MKTTMAFRSDRSDRNEQNDQPIVKIGHYILGETLGIGSFGKVKSKFSNQTGKFGSFFDLHSS